MLTFDVLVIGSGGAGMRAALATGSRGGLRVGLTDEDVSYPLGDRHGPGGGSTACSRTPIRPTAWPSIISTRSRAAISSATRTQSRFSGLALGITGEELGLGRHVTEAGRLTARLGR